jgi:hypothetical protein
MWIKSINSINFFIFFKKERNPIFISFLKNGKIYHPHPPHPPPSRSPRSPRLGRSKHQEMDPIQIAPIGNIFVILNILNIFIILNIVVIVVILDVE